MSTLCRHLGYIIFLVALRDLLEVTCQIYKAICYKCHVNYDKKIFNDVHIFCHRPFCIVSMYRFVFPNLYVQQALHEPTNFELFHLMLRQYHIYVRRIIYQILNFDRYYYCSIESQFIAIHINFDEMDIVDSKNRSIIISWRKLFVACLYGEPVVSPSQPLSLKNLF